MAGAGDPAFSGAVERLLSGYRPRAGTADELFGPDGAVRPVWRDFIEAIAAMAPDELPARTARGAQYLRDAGVYFRHYASSDAPPERDWPISHCPVLIDEREWAGIADGLTERAELLEAVAADLYGPNRLVADGHLPAALVANNPEWLRPLVGVVPRGGHFLHFVAFDIGRKPDGAWWVLGDRTQAPSGAGFALENRIAASRVYSSHFARANVHRLAGFFRAFRDTLVRMRDIDSGRVGILTPGPASETYFEHAYIARYLGFLLLEGDDLTVVDGRLMVRTVAGLTPVSVLWRRLDSAWADPLELEETSAIGTAGMLGAVRTGNVTLVNALGSGVLESRAMLAFLPRICEALTGASLSIPNIATWWCGQPGERAHVKANAERMTIAGAFAGALPDGPDTPDGPGFADRAEARARWIDRHGSRLVAQESVTLSTTPAFEDGRLVPRPTSLRVFLARTDAGWTVMPGGFARIGSSGEATTLAMQEGGAAADVWIVARAPVPAETMLPSQSEAYVRQEHAMLPSRAADCLFWLGRYVERAEHTVRLLRAHHGRLAESAAPSTPLLDWTGEHLAGRGVDPAQGLPAGVTTMLDSAIASAGIIRDRFSVDGWNALQDLSKTVHQLTGHVRPGDDSTRALGVILRKLTGFTGLVQDNMYRFTGWHFLSIGRSLERAISLTDLLARFADPRAPDGALDLAVEVADSEMSHRRRYAVASNRQTVIDLLALDPLNPRAVIHQLNEVWLHIGRLPGNGTEHQLSPLQRVVLQTRTGVAVRAPTDFDTHALARLSVDLAAISDHLGAAYFR